MPSQYVAALVPQINGILRSSDLSTISAKGVRKQLIASGHEESVIKENRTAIDEKIAEIYEKLIANHEPGSPDGPSASGSRPDPSASAGPPSSFPEPLRKAPKVKREVEHEVKEETYAPVRRLEETDEQMAARLQAQFDAEGSSSRASRSAGALRKKSRKVVKRKKGTGDGDSDDAKPKKKRAGGGGGAFNKELVLSDALADFTGEARLSRPQVVKRIWEYVKLHDLQDPADKRFIICDDALKTVFNTDKVHMFTMNKILADHVRDPAEVAFKDEPGQNGPRQEHEPPVLVTSSQTAPVKAEPAAPAQYNSADMSTDSEPELESEDDEDY
ncbi:hypothetical protein BD324DRAFT_612658 [Kockovaella imperatae]|uniref:DM2 domain-containing protein n=1 Tax=Kockovaella imperatae TaxID=4999 RepID=A0A1Y1USF7_9TREE|nr:hypothetical protein BD324DRAFT_612658 [Kockovaella imperatae]ORX40951.1 hypothetical protein BD324DRAFT_612658 [Kockovaella imperatae]